MSRLSPEELFRQSRVSAQGWNAARTSSLRTGPAAVKAMTNPYTSEPQRSRWDEGYAGALESYRTGLKYVPGQASRVSGVRWTIAALRVASAGLDQAIVWIVAAGLRSRHGLQLQS
jgi:hypothetical protein